MRKVLIVLSFNDFSQLRIIVFFFLTFSLRRMSGRKRSDPACVATRGREERVRASSETQGPSYKLSRKIHERLSQTERSKSSERRFLGFEMFWFVFEHIVSPLFHVIFQQLVLSCWFWGHVHCAENDCRLQAKLQWQSQAYAPWDCSLELVKVMQRDATRCFSRFHQLLSESDTGKWKLKTLDVYNSGRSNSCSAAERRVCVK